MNRKLYFSFLVPLCTCLLLATTIYISVVPSSSNAEIEETPEPTQEIIDLTMAPQITPEAPTPSPTPKVEIHEYEWTAEQIDAVASIYWAMGETINEKLAITQVIWNRMHYGAPFKHGLVEVCEQENEFLHGRVSDKNRELARRNLNYVKSQYEGYYAMIDIPSSALFISKKDGVMTLKDKNMYVVYTVE